MLEKLFMFIPLPKSLILYHFIPVLCPFTCRKNLNQEWFHLQKKKNLPLKEVVLKYIHFSLIWKNTETQGITVIFPT